MDHHWMIFFRHIKNLLADPVIQKEIHVWCVFAVFDVHLTDLQMTTSAKSAQQHKAQICKCSKTTTNGTNNQGSIAHLGLPGIPQQFFSGVKHSEIPQTARIFSVVALVASKLVKCPHLREEFQLFPKCWGFQLNFSTIFAACFEKTGYI